MSPRYILRRFVMALLVILGVSVIVFGIARLSGDPTQLMAQPGATQAELDAMRDRLGLNDPVPVQYLRFLSNALQGDFGTSIWQNQPALKVVLERMPATIKLTLAAMVFSIGFAIPAGIFSAVRRGSAADRFLMGFMVMGQSVPVFWLGLMLILLFSERLHWVPSSGTGTWKHFLLPAFTLGAFSMARTARMMRSCTLETLNANYVVTARAKGISEIAVVWRHAVRNSLLPVVTLIGLQFGTLLGGAVITETIFAWPGVGRLITQAIINRDFPVVQAAVLMLAIVFVLLNFVVDVLYMAIDPRVRHR